MAARSAKKKYEEIKRSTTTLLNKRKSSANSESTYEELAAVLQQIEELEVELRVNGQEPASYERLATLRQGCDTAMALLEREETRDIAKFFLRVSLDDGSESHGDASSPQQPTSCATQGASSPIGPGAARLYAQRLALQSWSSQQVHRMDEADVDALAAAARMRTSHHNLLRKYTRMRKLKAVTNANAFISRASPRDKPSSPSMRWTSMLQKSDASSSDPATATTKMETPVASCHVFISFRFCEAHTEALALQATLRELGVRTFVSDEAPGVDLQHAIANALGASVVQVLLASRTYGQKTNNSYSTYQEMNFSVEYGRPFLVNMLRSGEEWAETATKLAMTGRMYEKWTLGEPMPPGLVDTLVKELLKFSTPETLVGAFASLATDTSSKDANAEECDEAAASTSHSSKRVLVQSLACAMVVAVAALAIGVLSE